jgi:GT2 family glycosyltransferase
MKQDAPPLSRDVIAVVVITHDRLHLLEKCVENVLRRTSLHTREIVIWNNASQDGTQAYLDTLADPRIRIVHHPENIGTNAYARAFRLTTAAYLVEMDDDIIDAPQGWDERMLNAFRRIPRMGYLSANLVDDPNDSAAQYVKYLREERNAYTRREVDGIRILEGPTGGGCTMTSRDLYDRVGGFREHKSLVFWHEDAAYVRAIHRLGYRSAVLEDLRVWHAGSPYYSGASRAKLEFHEHQARVTARKDFVKRIILRLPFATALNDRYQWFEPPHRYVPPQWEQPPS